MGLVGLVLDATSFLKRVELPERQQEVFNLRWGKAYSRVDVAKMMDISEERVRQLEVKVKNKINKELEQDCGCVEGHLNLKQGVQPHGM